MDEVSLRLALLDAQVLDADELPVGRVDDVEIELDLPRPRITALLVGQRHLGPRLGGATGELVRRIAERLDDGSAGEDAARVPATAVAAWSDMIRLRLRLDEVPLAGFEKWLAAHVVCRIPGAGDEGL